MHIPQDDFVNCMSFRDTLIEEKIEELRPAEENILSVLTHGCGNSLCSERGPEQN